MTQLATKNLIIGTAGWGQPYGPRLGVQTIERREAEQLLEAALRSGVRHLDTAPTYGSTEALLGSIGVGDFEVTTKIPSVPQTVRGISSWIKETASASLRNLKKEKLSGLLLHDTDQLGSPGGQEIHETLLMLRDQGITRQVGLSVYQPQVLNALYAKGWLQWYDVVQAPLNIFDTRLEDSGWAKKLRRLGIKLQARSIFLQGVLLLDDRDLSPSLANLRPLLKQWREFVKSRNADAYSLAVGAVLAQENVSDYVVGVASSAELKQLVDTFAGRPVAAVPNYSVPEWFIDPRSWPRKVRP